MKFDIWIYIQDKKTKKITRKVRKLYSLSEIEMVIRTTIVKSDMRILALFKGGKNLRRF